MCGRFYLDVQADELANYFELQGRPDLSPRYNIAPSQAVACIRMGARGRELSLMHWGLIPFWARDRKIAYRTINARAETVDTKPAYRAAFRYRRCLIPASGFFEWKAVDAGKQPYCIHPKHAPLFAFAGLYEHWQGGEGEVIDSCSILVTEANRTIRPVHERMPVILSPEMFSRWLDPRVQDPAQVKPLLQPAAEDSIGFYPVSRHVNNPRNDDPMCIQPLR